MMIRMLVTDETSETATNVDSSSEQNVYLNENTTLEQNLQINESVGNNEEVSNEISSGSSEVVIDDWRLVLANYDNILSEDFEVELATIDEYRQFDARAIEYLNDMMNAMRNDGISNVWVQSAYRSVEEQTRLYNSRIEEYINKPGASDHNLGLAVDFNYVDNSFEDSRAFEWLQENAEDYGFILRYPKDKEDITKIKYEPWHWRFVGEGNAKKMNELGVCLEEYIENYNEYNK